MSAALLTAIGVGGSTMIGSLCAIPCRRISGKFCNVIISFTAGVMLAASILGMILPALQNPEYGGIFITIAGIMAGAFSMGILEHSISGCKIQAGNHENLINSFILFFIAMAIHNFPEGIAAGVSLKTGSVETIKIITGAISFQNIPEGFVTVMALLAAGKTRSLSLFGGILTGIIEMVGTLFGYWAVSWMEYLLPFTLACASGTMLFVIIDDIIPNCKEVNPSSATYSFLAGFCFMLICDAWLT